MMKRAGRVGLSILLIGSGQIVKGETRKGILLLLLAYLVLPAIFSLSLSLSDTLTRLTIFLISPLYLGLMVYSAVDAWM